MSSFWKVPALVQEKLIFGSSLGHLLVPDQRSGPPQEPVLVVIHDDDM
jgi:hypothetical protein